jgi:hypothetical protein
VDRSGRARWYARGVLVAVAIGGVAAAILTVGWNPTLVGGDAWNYLAAGERVAAGHSAYALVPGDRPVPIIPPYWTTPLLSPPAVLLVWAPLSRLGEASMTVWALANGAATVVAVTWLLRGRRIGPLVTVAVLGSALGLLALSGNVNGFLLLALVAIWAWRDTPAACGTVTAAAIATKLTPVFLVFWLIATRRWRALAVTIGVGAALALATVLLVGIDDVLEWLRTAPGSQPSPLALATLLRVSPVAIVIGLAAAVSVVALTRSERWTWVAATVATAFATPAFYFQAIALLAATVAPWSAPSSASTEPSADEAASA